MDDDGPRELSGYLKYTLGYYMKGKQGIFLEP